MADTLSLRSELVTAARRLRSEDYDVVAALNATRVIEDAIAELDRREAIMAAAEAWAKAEHAKDWSAMTVTRKALLALLPAAALKG